MKKACVVVLGDVARSPRMMNHIQSLVSQGYVVEVVGYFDTELPPSLAPKISVRKLHSKLLQVLKNLPRKLFLVYALGRLLAESLQLFFTLLFITNLQFILMQNPPSMPTMLIISLISYLKRIPWVIDWHNFAYSLLEVNKRPNFIVQLARFYELCLGKTADLHVTVSQAFADELSNKDVSSLVLYDRPVASRSFSNKNMRSTLNVSPDAFLCVSSTSWTEDEDFSIVLKALDILESSDVPLHLIITGKGPLKDHYKNELAKKQWKNCKVDLVWLSLEEYHALLAQCDLGICLHTSSSGLDLPMKVVDMHAAALPALCFEYQAIYEFIQPGVNGDVFKDAADLAKKVAYFCKNKRELTTQRTWLQTWRLEHAWEHDWALILAHPLSTLPRKPLLPQLLTFIALSFFLKLLFF